MSHVSHRSTLPQPPDRVGRLTGTAAVSVHASSIAGGTQRDPEGTSREPRRRCYGHRRGISLPKAAYQNAARMSRGAEGTTEASGRRDQAGLAARKRRVGAVRGAVPAQNEPKSDRRRAKTPMNRRKSRLRRRAAPISFGGQQLPVRWHSWPRRLLGGPRNVKLFGMDAGRRRRSSDTVHGVAKVVGPPGPPPGTRRAAPTRAAA